MRHKSLMQRCIFDGYAKCVPVCVPVFFGRRVRTGTFLQVRFFSLGTFCPPEKRTRGGYVYGYVRVRFLGWRVRTGTFFRSTGTQNLDNLRERQNSLPTSSCPPRPRPVQVPRFCGYVWVDDVFFSFLDIFDGYVYGYVTGTFTGTFKGTFSVDGYAQVRFCVPVKRTRRVRFGYIFWVDGYARVRFLRTLAQTNIQACIGCLDKKGASAYF